LFARASLVTSIVTIIILLASSPKQKDCPAPTLSEQTPGTTYVFTDPAVATRRAQSALDTEKLHKRSCKSDPKGYDCRHSAPMPKPTGGQTISG
jgi:hypothetical protein